MADEQNQLLLRAFASHAAQHEAAPVDEAFVAAVTAGVRRRRRLQWRLRLLATIVLLAAAALLAPFVAEASTWATGAALWLVTSTAALVSSPVGATTAAALVFAAGVVVWATRRV